MYTNVGKYYNFIRIEIQVDIRTNGLMDRETDRQMDRRLDGYKEIKTYSNMYTHVNVPI